MKTFGVDIDEDGWDVIKQLDSEQNKENNDTRKEQDLNYE
jgi:hypothetical protein